MIEITPWLLISWKESHYLEKFRDIFKDNNEIILPERNDKPVIVFTDKDNPIYHIWRWWWFAGLKEEDFNFDEPKFFRRAQRILWIKYLLENQKLRTIYKDKNNWYICFVSTELEYSVVLREAKTCFILITAYHTYDPYSYTNKDKRFEKVNTI